MLATDDRGHVVDRGYCVSAQLMANEPVPVTHTLAGITPADRYLNSASGSSREVGREGGTTGDATSAGIRALRTLHGREDILSCMLSR